MKGWARFYSGTSARHKKRRREGHKTHAMQQEEKGSEGDELASLEDIHLELYPVEDESRKDIAKDIRVSE